MIMLQQINRRCCLIKALALKSSLLVGLQCLRQAALLCYATPGGNSETPPDKKGFPDLTSSVAGTEG